MAEERDSTEKAKVMEEVESHRQCDKSVARSWLQRQSDA